MNIISAVVVFYAHDQKLVDIHNVIDSVIDAFIYKIRVKSEHFPRIIHIFF